MYSYKLEINEPHLIFVVHINSYLKWIKWQHRQLDVVGLTNHCEGYIHVNMQ